MKNNNIKIKGENKMKQNFKDSVVQSKDKLGREIKVKFQQCKKWAIANKDTLIIVAPVALAAMGTVVKVTGKHINLRKQDKVKNLYVYDNRLGHYWSLKRELTTREWLEIDARKAKGEKLSDILSMFKVLK